MTTLKDLREREWDDLTDAEKREFSEATWQAAWAEIVKGRSRG